MPNLPPRADVLLRSEETSGHVSITEIVVPAHSAGPPLHTHDFDEAFYMLDGELIFQLDEELVTKRAGDLFFAPRNVPTRSPTTARRPRATRSSARPPVSSGTGRASPQSRRERSRRSGRCCRSPRSGSSDRRSRRRIEHRRIQGSWLDDFGDWTCPPIRGQFTAPSRVRGGSHDLQGRGSGRRRVRVHGAAATGGNRTPRPQGGAIAALRYRVGRWPHDDLHAGRRGAPRRGPAGV